MNLADQLTDYVHATLTGLWVQSSEPDEAEREIVQHARQQGWAVAVGDVAGGLRVPASPDTFHPEAAPATPWPPCVPCPRSPRATARPCSCSTTSTSSSATPR